MLDFNTVKKTQNDIPIIGDKLLIDIINSISVNKNIVKYRKHNGIFSKFIDGISGTTTKGNLLLAENDLVIQNNLHTLILGITNNLTVSHLALSLTQESLLQTRQAIREDRERFNFFEESFGEVIDDISLRLDDIDNRVIKVEKKIIAEQSFNSIIKSWQSKRTYQNFPFLFQVIFLAKEIFSSLVILFEFEQPTVFRKRFIDEISSTLVFQKHPFSVVDLINNSIGEVVDSQSKELLNSLLNSSKLDNYRSSNMPIYNLIGNSIEFSLLSEEAKPVNVAKFAFELQNRKFGSIYESFTMNDLVKTIVDEIADESLFLFQNITVNEKYT